jgi:hypothetical protein
MENMERRRLTYVTGINFTDQSKEAIATCLKENMRTVECSKYGWRRFIDTPDGS